MDEHVVRLTGKGGAVVDPSHGPLLRELLDVLVDGCQQATRLRVEGRSTAPGTIPAWLEKAATFEVAKIRRGEVVMTSHSLSAALPDRFSQLDLFEEIEPAQSCLDLFEQSLEDALAERADSARYDPPLMATLEGLGRLFRYGVDRIELVNGRTLRMDRDGLDAIRRLALRTPEDRRVMVAGKLETIRHSDRAFSVVVESGESLRGVVVTEQISPAHLAALFGKQALVSGYAKFRPSGAMLRIEADQIGPASPGELAVFSEAPTPLFAEVDLRELRKPQGPKTGVAAIFGQWPGDETDEEVERALAELS